MTKEIKEIFKPVKGYESLYEISNLGRIKSLAKEWKFGNGSINSKPETFMKPAIARGYKKVVLYNKGKYKTVKVHTLVWDAFGSEPRNGMKLEVDHIDENKLNNRIDNLQLLTQRQNVSKGYLQREKTSEYTGVSWNKRRKKWVAMIHIAGKTKNLGSFNCEEAAMIAYQERLKGLNIT